MRTLFFPHNNFMEQKGKVIMVSFLTSALVASQFRLQSSFDQPHVHVDLEIPDTPASVSVISASSGRYVAIPLQCKKCGSKFEARLPINPGFGCGAHIVKCLDCRQTIATLPDRLARLVRK